MAEQNTKQRIKSIQHNMGIAKTANRAALYLAQMLQSFKNISKKSSSVVASSEELSSSIKEISGNIHNVSNDAMEAENAINQSIGAADNAINVMGQISDATNESVEQINQLAITTNNIFQILRMINDISKKTHLLALNATIEAARAGEAGKGFSVVAKEVKSLAEQTAKATEEIKMHTDQLNIDMQTILQATARNKVIVDEGQTLIGDAVSLLKSSATSVGAVSDKMQEVSSILEQQTIATQEIAQNITNVSDVTNENVKYVELGADAITETTDIVQKAVASCKAEELDDKSICELAKLDHILFKKKIIDTFLGKENVQAEDLPDHHQCRLGKWYDNITANATKDIPAFKELAEPHANVHMHGKEALAAFFAEDLAKAAQAMDNLEQASVQVIEKLSQISENL